MESEDEPVESIYGWVWDDYSSDDLTGVDVTVYPVGSAEPYATTTTNYGFYVFEDLPAGSYDVQFSHADFFPEWWDDVPDRWQATHLSVADGQPVEASAELGLRASIEVTVTNAAKKPLADRWVQLWLIDDAGEWQDLGGAWTDSNGQAAMFGLPAGYYQVGDNDLPKDARLKVTGHYVSLLAYSGTKSEGWLSPFIEGEPSTGSTLKIDRGPGRWKKTTFSYQWLRDGGDIAKATQSTYKTGIADRDLQLQVRMTAKQGNNTFTVVSPTSWWITLVGVPTITGTAAVGSTVTVDEGTWDEYIGFSYQWYADGKTLSGATDRSLGLTSSHKGKKITVKVTGRFESYPAYPDLSRTSAATGKVATVATPTVSGALAVGSTLTAKPGTWTKKTKFSYQWLRDGAAISKATKSSYKLTGADEGTLITVRVTGKLSGYATVAKESAGTVKVLKTATPVISGTFGTGNELTLTPGTWTVGTAFTQQWYADGKELTGETGETLALTTGLAGKKITVKVTGELAGHATATTTSKASAKVLLVGLVTAEGTLVEGSTLTAKPGTWTKKTKLSYQWLRDGAVIAKATKSSYKLTATDVGKVVTVRVTGKLSGYGTVSASSPAGDPVTAP